MIGNNSLRILMTVRLMPLLFLVLVGNVSCSSKNSGERKPNSYELLYQQIAVDNDDPRLCYKISPTAYLTASWGGEDSEVSYLRSTCFYFIAQNTGRAELCSEVVEAKRPWANGSKYTEKNCMIDVKDNRHSRKWSGMYVPPGMLIPILQEVGYSADTMPERHRQYLKDNYEEAWVAYYLDNIKRDPEFIRQLLTLTSFDK